MFVVFHQIDLHVNNFYPKMFHKERKLNDFEVFSFWHNISPRTLNVLVDKYIRQVF